jgi:phosphatidate cytidylyltransferase
MVAEGDERGRQSEDTFDGLDSYFGAGDQAARSSKARASSSGDRGGTGSEEPDQESGEAGLDEELLPPGWEPDVDALHLDDEEAPDAEPTAAEPTTPEPVVPIEAIEPVEPEEPVEPVEPVETEGPRPAPDEFAWGPDVDVADADLPVEDTSMWSGEPAEVGGDDWRRLRDVLDEEEGTGELSIEDLKKAPPEYSDLPGAYEGTMGPETLDVEGPGPSEPEDEGQAGPAESPWDEPEPRLTEPDIAEVEAAADRLAYEFRDAGEPDDVEKDLLSDLERPGPRTVRVGPEGLTGPTWEEPTSRVVMAEPAPITPARDMPAALITAVVLAAAALISLAVSKAAFAAVAGLVVLLGQAELYGAMNKRGHQPATALGLVVGALILAGGYLKGEAAMLFFVGLGLVLSFLWYMAAAPKHREGAIGNIGTTMLGIVYVPFLAAYMLVVLSQPNSGRATMLAVLGLTFLYDVAAFVIGSFWGARALAPTISPRKSWEGLFGATVFTVTVAIAVLPSINPIDSVARAVGLAVIVVLFAPLGDLAESAIKRDLGVKDMGSILPGHGGVLDRIDSVLFVAPAAFYFLRLIF